ncbi:MAG: RlpA-like double-psi beta-barrel domain-containing protein [Patescibacteria group bacterium]|nr:serine hydrolase [Patescibacteria group bacterium]
MIIRFKRFFLFLFLAVFFIPSLLMAEELNIDPVFDDQQVFQSDENSFVEIKLSEEKIDAINIDKEQFNIYLDRETILKGYTVSAFDDYIKLSLVPGILDNDTDVLLEEILDSEMSFPWSLKKISSVVQFEFVNKTAYDNHKPFYIQLNYDENDQNYKQVFFYDKGQNLWRPLPTKDYPEEKFVRSLIHLPYARLAVFSYPGIEISGKASWYKFKGGDFTASTVYPKGSLLRVYNKENNKYVDVVVNDFGPERDKFPDRVLDLDYEAFKKIAGSGAGVIDVFIEPLNVPRDNFGRILGVGLGVNNQPGINSVSAVLIDEEKGRVVFEKNADQIMPVASLSKLLSTLTFFSIDNNINRLEEIVKYSLQDEEYNHQYFNKWQVARINLSGGDELSIKDAVYSSLVRSANNMVETLVRVSGLSRDDFIKKMNSIVKELDLSSSKFFEPTGLDKKNVSTAREFALIAQMALDNKVIAEASTTKSYRFFTRNDNSLKLRYNSSDLVLNNNYSGFKIIGSKTGYIDDSSGYCLVTRIDVAGKKYTAVILNSLSREQSFKEMLDLLNFAVFDSKK